MKDRSFNHVRTHRKRNALSTTELASLVGLAAPSAVRRLERGERAPSLKTAIGLQVVFGTAPREMFPGLYEAVEETVMREAEVLYTAVDGREDPRSRAKRELLDAMPGRSLANEIEA